MTWFDDTIHGEDITLVHVATGKPDANGRASIAETEETLHGYSVQPDGTAETDGNKGTTRSKWRVSGPPITGLADHDRIRWRGAAYDVDGDPQTFGTVLPHTEFTMLRVRG